MPLCGSAAKGAVAAGDKTASSSRNTAAREAPPKEHEGEGIAQDVNISMDTAGTRWPRCHVGSDRVGKNRTV